MNASITVPLNIRTEADLIVMLELLLTYITAAHEDKIAKDKSNTVNFVVSPSPMGTTDDGDALKEQIANVGARVKVKWTPEQIGDSGWKPGWYVITLQYVSEPGSTYTEELTPILSDGSIKLVQAVL